MADNEPNGFELQRSLERVEKNIGEVKELIKGLVSRDLFDFESRIQNDRILSLEQTVEKNENNAASSKQRFWLQTVIPLAMIVTSIAITLVNYYHH